MRFSVTAFPVFLRDSRGEKREHAGMSGVRLSWMAVALGVAGAGVAIWIGWLSGHLYDVTSNLPPWAAFGAMGAVALKLRPENRAARRLAVGGASIGIVNGVGAVVALLAQRHLMGDLAWLGLVAYESSNWLSFVPTVALFGVFPDGLYQRPYERRLVIATGIVLLPLLLFWMIGSPTLADPNVIWYPVSARSPIAIPGLAALGGLGSAVQAPTTIFLLALVILALRYRRFGPEQRRQIRWPLYALAVTAVFFAALFIPPRGWGLPLWAQAIIYYGIALLIPTGILIGIVRHRLLDVDVVIRRSLVYGVLWALIALAYVGIAAALGVALGRQVPLALAIGVTVVATLVFQPARRRLEALADRLVFGHRLSGYELISQLGARLESSPAAEDVAGTVATAVQAGLGAGWVRVILNGGERNPLVAVGIVYGPEAEPVLSAPLVHGGDVIGQIECGAKRDGRYDGADRDLLTNLGRQAALAIRNSQLATELAARLDDLAASRARLVVAEEAGRRRLERDLHDGVQQELVGLLARLGLARNQLQRDAAAAEQTLGDAQVDARRALESVQELARGIHPAVLTDRGLIEAVEERATRMNLPVDVTLDGIPRNLRLSPQLEGAAYFFVSEALANVLKHSRARSAAIRLECLPAGRLLVEVRDDGSGFDPSTTGLSGLRGLADRIDAVGGRMELTSGPLTGTVLRAYLPAEKQGG
jgi:signal transduction histidine kinase